MQKRSTKNAESMALNQAIQRKMKMITLHLLFINLSAAKASFARNSLSLYLSLRTSRSVFSRLAFSSSASLFACQIYYLFRVGFGLPSAPFYTSCSCSTEMNLLFYFLLLFFVAATDIFSLFSLVFHKIFSLSAYLLTLGSSYYLFFII